MQKCYFCSNIVEPHRGLLRACCSECFAKLKHEHEQLTHEYRASIKNKAIHNNMGICMVCNNFSVSRGFCKKHYWKFIGREKRTWTKKVGHVTLVDDGLVPSTPSVT